MHYRDGIHSAFQSIFSHKTRSLLTITGIVIGVLAVVSMFSSVYALKTLINKNMEGMGWNLSLVIIPGSSGYVWGSEKDQKVIPRAAQNIPELNYDDFLAIKKNLSYKSIYGMIESTSLIRRGNELKSVRLRATTTEFFRNKSYPIGQGRYFNEYENDNKLPVAVLGSMVAKDYFAKTNPVGKILQLGSQRFTVVGVLAGDDLNSGNGMNFNAWERKEDLKAIYVPLHYGASYLGTGGMVHQIYVQAANEKNFNELKKQARQLLLSRHNMYPNFSFMDIGAMMLTINNEIEGMMRKWNITLIAIASISLIVGGIGLFSTLLISIQERMSEIGIRKSIGASEKDIFFYFIFESLALASLGAAFGVLLAWLLLIILAQAIHFPFYLPIQGVSLGIGFSLLIGFISGLYPALKAAGIDPIQAIYYRE